MKRPRPTGGYTLGQSLQGQEVPAEFDDPLLAALDRAFLDDFDAMDQAAAELDAVVDPAATKTDIPVDVQVALWSAAGGSLVGYREQQLQQRRSSSASSSSSSASSGSSKSSGSSGRSSLSSWRLTPPTSRSTSPDKDASAAPDAHPPPADDATMQPADPSLPTVSHDTMGDVTGPPRPASLAAESDGAATFVSRAYTLATHASEAEAAEKARECLRLRPPLALLVVAALAKIMSDDSDAAPAAPTRAAGAMEVDGDGDDDGSAAGTAAKAVPRPRPPPRSICGDSVIISAVAGALSPDVPAQRAANAFLFDSTSAAVAAAALTDGGMMPLGAMAIAWARGAATAAQRARRTLSRLGYEAGRCGRSGRYVCGACRFVVSEDSPTAERVFSGHIASRAHAAAWGRLVVLLTAATSGDTVAADAMEAAALPAGSLWSLDPQPRVPDTLWGSAAGGAAGPAAPAGADGPEDEEALATLVVSSKFKVGAFVGTAGAVVTELGAVALLVSSHPDESATPAAVVDDAMGSGGASAAADADAADASTAAASAAPAAATDAPPPVTLDLGACVCLEDGTFVGLVADVIAALDAPTYVVRPPVEGDEKVAALISGVAAGTRIYAVDGAAPTIVDFAAMANNSDDDDDGSTSSSDDDDAGQNDACDDAAKPTDGRRAVRFAPGAASAVQQRQAARVEARLRHEERKAKASEAARVVARREFHRNELAQRLSRSAVTPAFVSVSQPPQQQAVGGGRGGQRGPAFVPAHPQQPYPNQQPRTQPLPMPMAAAWGGFMAGAQQPAPMGFVGQGIQYGGMQNHPGMQYGGMQPGMQYGGVQGMQFGGMQQGISFGAAPQHQSAPWGPGYGGRGGRGGPQ